MKRPEPSRGSAAKKSATHSNDVSTETIGTPPETPNGSSIGTIDPTETSYFIQYQPELAEKLSKHSSTYSVSGRCLSIVFSRMLYWSRFAKHRHNGKLFYWKNQTELSQETSFSIKQINRALKVLVELGLIIREKFMKHRYFQCYFYHIPVSPFTRELSTASKPKQSTNGSIRSSRTSSSGSGGAPQRFHSTTSSTSRGSTEKQHQHAQTTAAGSAAPNAAVAAGSARRKIGGGIGFKTNGTNRTNHSKIIPTSIKHSLKDILERCNQIGEYGIEIINQRG
jgi:hypothetical protein